MLNNHLKYIDAIPYIKILQRKPVESLLSPRSVCNHFKSILI